MLARAQEFLETGSQHDQKRPRPIHPYVHLVFPGDPISVRDALKRAMVAMRAMAIDADLRGIAEIVLAEVLNNVVEHAYADHGRGVIEVELGLGPVGLDFRVRDDGLPMPEEKIPTKRHGSLDLGIESLPEGGFGWAMIRDLAHDLEYRRVGNRNELTFRLLPESVCNAKA